MKIEFQLISSLPCLAWCACLRKNAGVVRILHGPWVETRNDCFFEGAWDGPIEAYRFDEASMLAGSGGRIVGEAILFASPGHMGERLFSLSMENELHVSNSFVFLLAQAGEELDINFPNYFLDFLNYYQSGIRITEKRIPIQDRRNVYLHDCCNMLVKSDLTISRIEKNLIEPLVDFKDYVAFLERTTNKIFENAMHPARKQVYRPVTTISQGYDSTAASVLASKAGCREAMTFRNSLSDDGNYVDDSGTAIAGYLGLQTTEYERLDFNKLSGLPTAEFFLNPFTMAETLAIMEDQLVGALLITGIFGDPVWGMVKQCGLPLLQDPLTKYLSFGTTMTEFRLRVGFLHLPAAGCGAFHRPSIYRITISPQMRPWSVGGEYDRPIPRRIVEEAGVPRELFGRRKMIGEPLAQSEFSLSSPGCERDFQAFYQANVSKNGPRHQPVSGQREIQKGIVNRLRPLGKLLGPSFHRKIRFFIGDRLDPRWGSKELYRFHWGFERTKERYQSALSRNRT